MAAGPRREPASALPRAAAPETHVDLSAMRELANLSAQTAINRHARRTLVGRMHSKLIVAAVAFTACGGLFWMWQRTAPGEVTFYAALFALLVAVYWGVHYALLTGRLIVSRLGYVARDSSTGRGRMRPPTGQDVQDASGQSAGPPAQDGEEQASAE